MKRVFNMLLILCGLCLAAQVILIVVVRTVEDSRKELKKESPSYVDAMAQIKNKYPNGGNPSNSALVFIFDESENPDTVGVFSSPVYFNFEGRNRAVHTGWIGENSGFLVVDRTGEGRVQSGRDLMGNHYLNGDPHFQTGLDALIREDSNGDGLIDPKDPIWSSLRIWRDRNTNGIVDKGELQSLDSLGISSISLSWAPVGHFLPDYNYQFSSGIFHYTDGRQGRMAEVFFQMRPTQREFLDKMTIPSYDFSPPLKVKGSGWLRDLEEAAAYNQPILDNLTRFSQLNRKGRREMLPEVLLSWADTLQDYSTLEERAQGRYNLVENCFSGKSDSGFPDMIKVLETFSGRYMFLLPHELYPGQNLQPEISISGDGELPDLSLVCSQHHIAQYNAHLNRLEDKIYYQLVPIALSRYFDLMPPPAPGPTDMNLVQALFDQAFDQNPDSAMGDLLDFRMALLNENYDGMLFPTLEEYIQRKVESVELSEELSTLYQKIMRDRPIAEKRAREKRIRQMYHWGVSEKKM